MSLRNATIPMQYSHLVHIRNKVYRYIQDFNVEAIRSEEPIPYDSIPMESFTPIDFGDKWAGQTYGCAWFRVTGKIPEGLPESAHLVVIAQLDGEGLVYDKNGNIVRGLTSYIDNADRMQTIRGKCVIELSSVCENGEVYFLVDAGNNKFNRKLKVEKAKLQRIALAVCDDTVLAYFYDYLTAYTITMRLDKGDKDFSKFTRLLSSSYMQVLKGFNKGNVKNARAIVQNVLQEAKIASPLNLSAVGHAHLDLAWLWPLRETKRKSVRTISNALLNLDKYEDFIMGISQPQQVEWLKDTQPALYAKFRDYVAKGRIDVQGGMWVESDCNLISGESMVRQFIYGKRFWKKEFDKDVVTCWLPDAFGFNGQMPQILTKCGAKYFYTIKMTWNTVNTFPHHSFWWEGIDGTRVLAHISSNGDYNCSASPLAIAKIDRTYKEKSIAPEALMVYGMGDGGGGPGEFALETLQRVTKLPTYHNVRQSTAEGFFDRLARYGEKLPVYSGELYLEKHQGVYTTQAKNKAYNRRIEFLLTSLEALAVAAKPYGGVFPREKIDEVWKEVLLYQFHDILPGSSIQRVYEETARGYERLIATLETEADKLYATLPKQDGATLINYSPFGREEWYKYQENWYKVTAAPYAASQLNVPNTEVFSDFNYGEKFVENDKIKLVFDEQGTITSFVTKADNAEYCGEYMNKLFIYEDRDLHYNAWDIYDKYYFHKKPNMVLKSVRMWVDGPQLIRQQSYTFNKSEVVQNIVLSIGDEMVKFDCRVDWQESNVMLRSDSKPKIYADEITCDVAFGNLKRRTTDNNTIERAQYEISAHKYVNLDTDDRGIAFLNNCKYGLRAKEGTVSLNLLRSPCWPDPDADRGEQYFIYAFLPHTAPLEQSTVMARSYALNLPLVLREDGAAFTNVAQCDNQLLVISTIKPAEDGRGTVLRMFNNCGTPQSGAVTVSFAHGKCYESDLLENVTDKETDLANTQFSPYEIKTLYFTAK